MNWRRFYITFRTGEVRADWTSLFRWSEDRKPKIKLRRPTFSLLFCERCWFHFCRSRLVSESQAADQDHQNIFSEGFLYYRRVQQRKIRFQVDQICDFVEENPRNKLPQQNRIESDINYMRRSMGNYLVDFSWAFYSRTMSNNFRQPCFQEEIRRKVTHRPRNRLPRAKWLRRFSQVGACVGPIGDKRSKKKVRDRFYPILVCGWICCIGICRSGSEFGFSESDLRNSGIGFGNRKSKSESRNLGSGKSKIENGKWKIGKMESGVKLWESEFRKRKIRNRNSDRKSGNRFW